jgi:hypothetical protein
MKEQDFGPKPNELTNRRDVNRLGNKGKPMPEPGNNEVGINSHEGTTNQERQVKTPPGQALTEVNEESQVEMKKSLFKDFNEHMSLRPEDKQEEQQIMNRLDHFIERFEVIEAATVDPNLLEMASEFKELREKLINRLIFKAYEDQTETNEYHKSMNLYSEGNLNTLLGLLRLKDPGKYQEYISLRTTAEHFHGMNATMNTGNLENFMRVAENITYHHFEEMKVLTGLPEVQRIYERKYNEYLAKNKRITTEGYAQLKKEVETEFRALNEAGLIRSDYEEGRYGDNKGKLQDWEVERALNVGRVFYNISFRAAERIATGQVPRAGDQGEKRYASFPMEQAVKLMNWVQWGGWRFDIAAARGGITFLEGVKDRNQDFMKQKGKKIANLNLPEGTLLEVGGMNIEEMEAGGMFGTSGLYSSWRIENMIFPKITLGEHGSLRQFFDSLINNENYKKVKKEAKERIAKDGKEVDLNDLQNKILDIYKPLIDNIQIGIGAILKHSEMQGALFYKVRKALWEKVADKNLPVMMNYLKRVTYGDEDGNSGQTRDILGEIINSDSSEWNKKVGEEPTKWEMLAQKITILQEYEIKKAAATDPSRISNPGIKLSADEERLIKAIKDQGVKLAPHLANVVFPYIPFLNDLPFEEIDFSGPGQEFYRRRTGGDLGSYFKAEGAFTRVMNNPGGMSYEDALKGFDEIIKGIESPQGTEDAQQKLFPMVNEWLRLVITTPGKRQALYKQALQMFRKPTSIAQTKEFAGIKGLSLDEAQAVEVLNQAVKAGIISQDLAQEMRKKEDLEGVNLLWMLIRDLFWVPFVSGFTATAGELKKMGA